MKRIILLGAGGYAKQIAWIIRRIGKDRVVGMLDETTDNRKSYGGVPIRNSIELILKTIGNDNVELVCGVGDIELRERWVNKYSSKYSFASVIDPTSLISPDSKVGRNVVILGHTVCSCDCEISDHVNVNWLCLVSHDVKIGAFTDISSGVMLTGGVTVGQRCNLGTNSVVLPGKMIHDNCTIGAGAVVTTDIPENSTAVGVPARVISTK
jgi:sugar O-acyltransferase (sialic acid O-acetyltransferase NeuD family)